MFYQRYVFGTPKRFYTEPFLRVQYDNSPWRHNNNRRSSGWQKQKRPYGNTSKLLWRETHRRQLSNLHFNSWFKNRRGGNSDIVNMIITVFDLETCTPNALDRGATLDLMHSLCVCGLRENKTIHGTPAN